MLVREPGSTHLGESLRRLLLTPDRGTAPPSPVAEALLYTSARAQLVCEVIRPALGAGSWVVCERYIDSTLAYQGYGLGLPVSELRKINEFATDGLWPVLTVLLDVPCDVGLQRSRERHGGLDRVESRGLSYHQRVAAGYRELACSEPGRYVVVDGRLPEDEVQTRIVREIERLLREV